MAKKYKIVFGNRRLAACKKLGMKTISAIINGKTANIPLDNVETTENIRTRIGDVSDLMRSIKERGLLQPIGLSTDSQAKDFLIDNTVENIQRKDISPIELGRACRSLCEKFDMSQSECAARLGVSMSVINTAIRLWNQVPKKYRHSIGYLKGGNNKKNIVSVSVAKIITNARTTKEISEEMFNAAVKHDLGAEHANILVALVVGNNIPVKEAIKEVLKAQTFVVHTTARKAELKKLRERYPGETQSLIVTKIIKGIYPSEPDLLY